MIENFTGDTEIYQMQSTESSPSHRSNRRDEVRNDGVQDFLKHVYVTIRVREKLFKGHKSKVLFVSKLTKKIHRKLLNIKRREND